MKRTLVAAIVSAVAWATVDVPGQAQGAPVLRSPEAMVALDRYLETWNSRDPSVWATSLHFPHVRPGPGAFEMSQTPEQYAAGIDFGQTLKTGWHHSEWVSRDVLQASADKVHAAGAWQRYAADGRPMTGSVITYIVTRQQDRWGVQARFAAGPTGIDAPATARNSAAALGAVETFMRAWNSHDPKELAATLHYPHVRIGGGLLEIWKSADEFLAGRDPGRQRTWFQTRLDQAGVVPSGGRRRQPHRVFHQVGPRWPRAIKGPRRIPGGASRRRLETASTLDDGQLNSVAGVEALH